LQVSVGIKQYQKFADVSIGKL